MKSYCQESSSDFISLRQIERSYDLPPGSAKCFEVDPSREIGILFRFDAPDQSCNDLSLFRVFFVKPSSQAAENGVCRGDYIYQIGETRITIHDDFQAVLLEEKTRARLNDSTYKLIILPAEAFEAGKRENIGRLPAETDDNDNVNIVSDTSSDSLLQEEFNAVSVRAGKRPWGQMTSSMQEDPSLLPTSIGDGVSTVKAKNVKKNCEDRINHIHQSYFLWRTENPESHFPSDLSPAAHVIIALSDEDSRDPRFRGPQPWMLFRKYVVYKVDEWHQINGSDWMKSKERLQLFEMHYLPVIKSFLSPWILPEYHRQLPVLCQRIWHLVVSEYISPCSDGKDWFIRYKITERIVLDLAQTLFSSGLTLSVALRPPVIPSDDKALSRIDRKLGKVTNIQYDVFPLFDNIHEVINRLRNHVYDVWVNPLDHLADINREWLIEALDDLEDDEDYLSYINKMFKGPHYLNLSLRSASSRSRIDVSFESAWSSDKKVGSRVYCRYSNGQYYWGKIASIKEKNSSTRYFVKFEDGCVLDNIKDKHVYSEADFVESFERPPPVPLGQPLLNVEKESTRSLSLKPSLCTAADTSPVGIPSANLNFEELYDRRCGTCSLCTKTDCKHCFTCKRGLLGRREICLRKMCCRITLEEKAQLAPGFPTGWKFFFEDPKQTVRFRGYVISEAEAGLKFITPGGRLQYLDKVRKRKEITREVIDSFLTYVGFVFGNIENHFLLGKGYRHEWMDAKGTKKSVYGKIISCIADWSEGCMNEIFMVEFSEESCKLTEEASSYSAAITRIQEIPSRVAYGGVLSYHNYMQKQKWSVGVSIKKAPIMCWLTPEMRLNLADAEFGLPKLKFLFRGWQLEMSIKTSTIQNAGYGCFMQCTPLVNIDDVDALPSFPLLPGELLDLGVYAPFREEDKKLPCIFKLKNFIHSFEPEEWVFGSPDGMVEYDITEEATGKPHSIAQKNVYMYVNETLDPFPTIYAENDPEGFVHYLFGIEYDGDIDAFNEGMRKLNADIHGGEFEVFVYYGKEYEKVRKRKGYSTDSRGGEVDLLKDEESFLKEISEFEKEDVFAVLDYLSGPFFLDSNGQKVETLSESVKKRLLRVFYSLKTRIRCLENSTRQSERCDFEVPNKLLDALRMKVYTSF